MVGMLQPVVRSMILCEDVVPGPEGTGNVHLMNVFSAIRPRLGFPYRLPELCVFLQLSDAIGQAPGRIVGCQADTDRLVFASPEHLIRFHNRLQVKWALFRLKDCPFPTPGLYWIEFHCNGRWVADQSVLLQGGS